MGARGLIFPGREDSIANEDSIHTLFPTMAILPLAAHDNNNKPSFLPSIDPYSSPTDTYNNTQTSFQTFSERATVHVVVVACLVRLVLAHIHTHTHTHTHTHIHTHTHTHTLLVLVRPRNRIRTDDRDRAYIVNIDSNTKNIVKRERNGQSLSLIPTAAAEVGNVSSVTSVVTAWTLTTFEASWLAAVQDKFHGQQ